MVEIDLKNPPQRYVSTKYLKAIQDLQTTLDQCRNNRQKSKIYQEFTTKYTTLPEIWTDYFELEKDIHLFSSSTKIKEITQLAMSQFHSTKFTGPLTPGTIMEPRFSKVLTWPYFDILKFKLLNVDPKSVAEGIGMAEQLLTFPHWKLDEVYNLYKKRSKKEIPEKIQRNYEYCKHLYNLIHRIKDDDVKWLKFLAITGNEVCIVQNIEVKLADNPWNLALWLVYIKYLKKHESATLLDVYARCCRLFIELKGLRNEYFLEVQRSCYIGRDVTKWWKHLIETECMFGSPIIASNMFSIGVNGDLRARQELIACSSYFANTYQLKIKIEDIDEPMEVDRIVPDFVENEDKEMDFSSRSTFENPMRQDFSLPNNIIFYALKKLNTRATESLITSCKMLYPKHPLYICNKLVIGANIIAHAKSRSCARLTMIDLPRVVVKDRLVVNVFNNRNFVQWFYNSVYRCEATRLDFTNQDFPLEFFKSITKNAISLSLNSCVISTENKDLNISDIIEAVPTSNSFEFGMGYVFNNQILNRLLAFNFSTKFERLMVCASGPINPDLLLELILKSAAPGAQYILRLPLEVNMDYRQIFANIIKSQLQGCSIRPRPKILLI